MPWRDRFIEYLQMEQADLERRIGTFEAGKCRMWEECDGERKDVTDIYAATLKARLAEIEKILIEEGMS